MLPRHLPELPEDRMGRLRTACRRRHAIRTRRRPLHLRSGHRSGAEPGSDAAVPVPPLTGQQSHEPAGYDPAGRGGGSAGEAPPGWGPPAGAQAPTPRI
ncbi:hypothetical protein TVH25_19350, partial [Rhodococcus sp. 7Tela_A2]|uniref:hypothetical protein n=1 Tax=Rhodococcus sp. 7Tela_A2 TaxID=3093744 RepID=UPI003BB686D8